MDLRSGGMEAGRVLNREWRRASRVAAFFLSEEARRASRTLR